MITDTTTAQKASSYFSNEILSYEDKQDPKKIGAKIESMFYSMIFKEMRKAKISEDILGSSQLSTLEEMQDQELAMSFGEMGNLGISEMIATQISQHESGIKAYGLLKQQ